MADRRTESSAARTDVNRNLRMAVKRFDLSGLEEETWDFLCECGAEGCKEWVTLPLTEYEALRKAEKPLLSPGHRPDPARRSRQRARRLAEDAKALCAQAEVQVRRAVRNLT